MANDTAPTRRKFKYNRALACYYMVDMLAHASPGVRSWTESLTLGAGIIYIMNALFYTPDTGAAWRSLASCVTMNIPDEDASGYNSDESHLSRIPMKDIDGGQGLFFFGKLVEDHGLFRLTRHYPLPTKDLLKLYGEDNMFNLRAHFQSSAIRRGPAPRPQLRRFTNNTSHTTRITESRVEPIPDIDFGLTARGIEFTNTTAMTGPDVEQEFDDDDDGPENMDQRVSALWYQMLHDVLVGKGPNPRSHNLASYASLEIEERGQVGEEIFKSFCLPFSTVRYRLAPAMHWSIMFDRFFPPPQTTLPHTMQGFPACRYFQDYNAMISQMERNDIKTLRKALKDRWDGLHWMPYTGADRMWVTRAAAGKQAVVLPPDWKGPAPLVALNMRFTRGVYTVELAGEQEE